MSSVLILKSLAAAGVFFFILSIVLEKYSREQIARMAFAGGFAAAMAMFLLQWIQLGEPPFGNMFHVLSFLPLILSILYGIEHYFGDKKLLTAFAVVGIFAFTGVMFMTPDMAWKRAPALQSFYFVPHVASYVTSYSLAAVSAVLTLKAFRNPESGKSAEKLALLSFAFMTAGLVTGALWAEEAWGNYWSWDIKESWSLITFLLYANYFHCRKLPGKVKLANFCNLLAFGALLVTFFVVNLMPKIQSLHSYSQ